MELVAVGCSPGSYGHRAMSLWRILCKMVSMHLGKGHYPSAVPHTFLVLFSVVRSVLRADSVQPTSWMVKSSTALLCFYGSPSASHLLHHGSWLVVDVAVAAPEEHSQACAGRSGQDSPKGQSRLAPRVGGFLIAPVSGSISP